MVSLDMIVYHHGFLNLIVTDQVSVSVLSFPTKALIVIVNYGLVGIHILEERQQLQPQTKAQKPKPKKLKLSTMNCISIKALR